MIVSARTWLIELAGGG